MVSASEVGTAFVPWSGTGLADLLCVQEARVVAKDNTVRYQGTNLQIPQDPIYSHTKAVTPRRITEVSLPPEQDADRIGARSAGLCLASLSLGSLEFVDFSVRRFPLR